MGILDIIDSINLLARLEMIAGALWFNTRRSPKVHGTAARPSAHEIRVSRYGEWSGTQVAAFLRRYGIDVWGGRANTDHFIMYVKERQAKWADYLLRRQGIAVEGPALSRVPRRGDAPPAWRDR